MKYLFVGGKADGEKRDVEGGAVRTETDTYYPTIFELKGEKAIIYVKDGMNAKDALDALIESHAKIRNWIKGGGDV